MGLRMLPARGAGLRWRRGAPVSPAAPRHAVGRSRALEHDPVRPVPVILASQPHLVSRSARARVPRPAAPAPHAVPRQGRALRRSRALGGILRGAHQIPVQRGTADAAGSLGGGRGRARAGRVRGGVPRGDHLAGPGADGGEDRNGPARGGDGCAGRAGRDVGAAPRHVQGAQAALAHRGRRGRAGRRAGHRRTADEDALDATDRIMAAICEQVAAARADVPAAAREPEGDWWVRPPETAVVRSCRTVATDRRHRSATGDEDRGDRCGIVGHGGGRDRGRQRRRRAVGTGSGGRRRASTVEHREPRLPPRHRAARARCAPRPI